MRLGFTRKIWLFLFGTFIHGLGQAFMFLFLNFYLKSLGLEDSYTGLVNALPAFTTAGLSLPAVFLSRRFGEIRTIKLKTMLGLSGITIIALANGPLVAVLGSLLQGVGSAFVMVANSPFMAKETTESNRVQLFSIQMALTTGAGFLGNILGGRIPDWYGSISGVAASSLPALRAALLVSAVFQLTGLLSIMVIPNDMIVKNAPGKKMARFRIENKRLMTYLVFPSMLVGLGAGLTIPYLNLFVEAKFGIDFKTLGSLFGWTSLATAATVLVQPTLVKKLGHIKTGLVVEVASLPFLAMLAYSPSFGMVSVAMFTRGALMNATGPAWGTYAMEHLSLADRPVYTALNNMSWSVTWAVAATVSGIFRQYMGPALRVEAFHYLFAGTMLAYGLSMFLKYIWLYLPDKRSRSLQLEGIK